MSADPSTTEQIAAAVLAEHEQRVNQCTCGWSANMTGRVYTLHHLDEAHRAHVAQQIAARLDDGLRAKVLWLADNLNERIESNHLIDEPNQYRKGHRHALRSVERSLRALLDQTRTECDHPGIEHGSFSYTWPCPQCGICKFIGHGPLCTECYDQGQTRTEADR